jgi:deoxyribonuclease-4
MDKSYPTFGPSGHSQAFFDEGHNSTEEMPKWLSDKGLELFEYSFGRGVLIGTDTAKRYGEEAEKYGIEISVHAPYFINFASEEQEKAEKSIGYILSSIKILLAFGGTRCVFHVGSEMKQGRANAFARAKGKFGECLERIAECGEFENLIVCPETMGKGAQIGTLEEIIEFCNMGKNVYPCIDFGHVNALYGGTLKTADDFQRVIDKLFDGIGEEKTKNMHVHFSKIQYGAKGEIRHLTFEDDVYGPEFEPFAEVIVKNNLTPHILCESAGTQAADAVYMKIKWREVKVKVES